jgi:acyl-CoA synthetase (AMP-forming)/AMP-acid ligase II
MTTRIGAGVPDEKPALVLGGSGLTWTFGELQRRTDEAVAMLASHGLGFGDHIAVLFANEPELFPVVWAAQRTGLYYTPVNWHLTPDEATYIVADCGAQVLFASPAHRELTERISAVDLKRQFIDWFGPIVWEYYAGSEGNGYLAIDAADWLARPGSVGRAMYGTPHVLDDNGTELPAGEIGTIWFEGTAAFAYHNDTEKTAGAFNDKGWSTLGDVGRLDPDGYLYLSDRRVDLIISGGVNIYPQEIENVLTAHPAVYDAAVVGVPDEEMGQRVVAVVQAEPGADFDLTERLFAHCRAHLAGFKCPREVLTGELPRLPSGKLLRRWVRDWLANGPAASS